MNQISNIDYIYPVFMLLFGLFMIFSPGTFIRKVGYNEERTKAEKWLKWTGIGLCVFAPLLAGFFYYKMNA
ncbi:hypothetical protein GGR21_003514 [Dysgonomonas hofstadii]|uniref:Uncharacterized protein n=1 Tax=Dysgonomonas hofstadii TaxID=637886 RepID=A0A840CV97_9BACT|nr:hypothetical protein [Dysgonomonas hofstadii]MBB4037594.1 hypothetical protein [Dysgonomonas hofstadii]